MDVVLGGDAMQSERFNKLLDELDGCSLQTLKEKNARYAQNGDCLHNFRSGAEIVGGTPAEACWGYLTKHLVALRDKVKKNDFSDREDFLEKCQDTINYVRFLWCIGNDENTKLVCRDSLGRAVDPDTASLHEMVDKMCCRDPYGLKAIEVYKKEDNSLCAAFHDKPLDMEIFNDVFVVHSGTNKPWVYSSEHYYYKGVES